MLQWCTRQITVLAVDCCAGSKKKRRSRSERLAPARALLETHRQVFKVALDLEQDEVRALIL